MSATKTKHIIESQWSYLCFIVAECECGKKILATNKRELDDKWENHLQ